MGLSPMLVGEVFEIIRRLNRDLGITMLLVEQNANMALKAADYGYIMEAGEIVLDGTAAAPPEQRGRQGILSGRRQRRAPLVHATCQVVYKRRKRWL